MAGLFKELTTIVDVARKAAVDCGFQERTPTPLVSDFWGTSLAPSSSEVLVRELDARPPTEQDPFRIFTVQPCVRFADLGPSSDGTHLVYFHMFSLFVTPAPDSTEDVRWFLALLADLGAPVNNSYFTYFSGASSVVQTPAFPDFGKPLLDRLHVDAARCAACSGLANYLQELDSSATPTGRQAWGPRIEILAQSVPAVEYGTLIYWSGRTHADAEPFPPTLSLVFGIERVAQVVSGNTSVWGLPTFGALEHAVFERFFPEQPEPPFSADVRHALELVSAMLGISTQAPDLAPGGNGAPHQLRRIIRAGTRQLAHVGIDSADIMNLISDIPGIRYSPQALRRVVGWLSAT